MPRPKTDPKQKIEAYELYGRFGSRPTEVREALEKKFGAMDAVSLRTVNTWMAEFKDKDVSLDQPFEWHRIEYILELWYQTREEFREAAIASGNDPDPEPTVRDVIWWWRVHQAAPSLHDVEVYFYSRDIVVEEIYQLLYGGQDNLRGLWRRLAYKPWLSDERRYQLDKAVDIDFRVPYFSGLANIMRRKAIGEQQ